MSNYGKVMRRVHKRYDKIEPEELWNLDASLMRWFAPRIKKFIHATDGIIAWTAKEKAELKRLALLSELLTQDFVLKDIKWADVEYLVKSKKNRNLMNNPDKSCDDDLWAEARCIQEWLDLFSKYYRGLWW